MSDESDKKVSSEAEKSLADKDEAAAAADAGAPQATESVSGGESAEAKGKKPPVTAADANDLKKDEHVAQGEEHLVAEADRVNVGVIGVVTFVIMVTVVVTVIGVYNFFGQTFRGEIEKKQLAVDDPTLRDIRAMEQAHLTKYQWVDQSKGIVRMPKDRAKELVLAEYGKMAAYQPGAAVPAAMSAAPIESAVAPSPSASVAPSASASGSAAPVPSTSAAPSASAPHHDHPAPSASAPAPKK
jgi:hypothetical protein